MPTTTNLALTYPASSGYVANGAADMGTLAVGIDNYYAALTTYTPTTTNVTGATTGGRYVRMGKLGFVRAWISAGVATAAGTVTLSLPAGWTAQTTAPQPILATNGKLIYGVITSPGTSVTLYADANGTTFGISASVATLRLEGWVELT